MALVLALIGITGSWAMAQDGDASARTPTVLILPFENSVRQPNVEWISESFPEVLSAGFNSVGLFVISREDRLYAFDKMGVPAVIRPSLATLYLIAQQTDADYVILGSYKVDAQRLTMQAQVLDMKQLRLLPAEQQNGSLSDLIGLQSRLAWDLLRHMRQQPDGGRERFLQQSSPVRLDAFENYIRGLLATTRQEKIHRFRAAVEQNPQYYAAQLQLGRIYLAARDYDAACEALASIPASDEGYGEANFLLGLSEFYLEDYDKSAAAFQRTLERMAIGDVYNNLGVVALRRGQREAVEFFQKAVESDGNDADYRYNLAIAQQHWGDTAAAQASLQESMKLQPGDAEARSLLASLQAGGTELKPPARLRRNYDENAYRQLALEMHNAMAVKLASADPQANVASHLELARHFLESGQLGDAEKEYRAAAGLAPESAEVHAGLAHLAERKGDLPLARDEAQRSIKIKPLVEAYLVLARVNLKSSNPETAAQDIDQALWLEPGNAEALQLKHDLAHPAHP